MNESVMADTLPLTTECSPWIVPMSIMSLLACIAQTDGRAKFCYMRHQRPKIGLLIVCMSCIVILFPGLCFCSPYMYITLNTDVGEITCSFGNNTYCSVYIHSARHLLHGYICILIHVIMHALAKQRRSIGRWLTFVKWKKATRSRLPKR